ncbi:hypothetical protein [Ancylobacter sp. FA202]|uniref:hypothetical protein n=1 Tax=Ancylobacter sp. FA202 TaxID=1111106 RepID=UPI00039B193C|nr:hypothetical protein [Ancylobacter sp. FA202]
MSRRALEQGAHGPTARAAAGLPDGFDERVDRLLRHPGLRRAIAGYCGGMAANPAVRWPYNKLFDQLGRYLVCFMLIHNYYQWRERGGASPTLSALQKVAGASPRQTAGFVAALRAGRLVEVETDPADRRATLLRPSPVVIAEIGRSLRLFVEALDQIDPPSDPSRPARAARLEDADALGELIARSAAYVLANGTLLHPFPSVLFFAQRDCGYPLLTAVIGNHYGKTIEGAATPGPLRRRELADRFQVSAAHIGSLFAEAEARGWFRVAPGGHLVALDADFLAEFERWAVWQMVHVASLGEAQMAKELQL